MKTMEKPNDANNGGDSSRSSQPTGSACECDQWADVRGEYRLLTGHHENCPRRPDPLSKALDLIANHETTMKPEYPEGFLEQNLANCREKTMCEGGCEHHEYGVQPVRVIDRTGTPHDWGYYAYCPAAIEEDKRRGMDVITEGHDDFLPNVELTRGADNNATKGNQP